MKRIIFVLVVAGIFNYISIATPKGYLTYNVLKVPFETLEILAESGSPRFVRSSGYHNSGIDAAPFLGNTQIMYESGANLQEAGIKILGRTGDVVMVVSAADVTTPIEPGISFDGTRLVYVSRDVGTSDEDILHVARITGEDDSIIYTTTSGVNCDISRPRFTPDGASIVFNQYCYSSGYFALYRIPVNGGTPQKLVGLPYSPETPALSPDGRWLAFTQKSNGVYWVFIAQADGTNPRQVNLGGDHARYPAFSPDSEYFAVFTQNGISIINTETYAVARRINFNYSGVYGICWHLGARKSAGGIDKLKISQKSVSIKTEYLVPSEVPSYGLVLVDGVSLPLSDPTVWENKKDKKFMYNDKALKRKAKVVVKNGKGSVSAKKLELVEGTDYRTETQIAVGVNLGEESVAEILTLGGKGKYKAPK